MLLWGNYIYLLDPRASVSHQSYRGLPKNMQAKAVKSFYVAVKKSKAAQWGDKIVALVTLVVS